MHWSPDTTLNWGVSCGDDTFALGWCSWVLVYDEPIMFSMS